MKATNVYAIQIRKWIFTYRMLQFLLIATMAPNLLKDANNFNTVLFRSPGFGQHIKDQPALAMAPPAQDKPRWLPSRQTSNSNPKST